METDEGCESMRGFVASVGFAFIKIGGQNLIEAKNPRLGSDPLTVPSNFLIGQNICRFPPQKNATVLRSRTN